MIKVPIEPYWFNAVEWWMTNHNSNTEDFHAWLRLQGATVVADRAVFYPWVDFEQEEYAVLFILRWS